MSSWTAALTSGMLALRNSEREPAVVDLEQTSTGGRGTKRTESEQSLVIPSRNSNGNFMMKTVIESWGSRCVRSLASSTVGPR